MRPEAKARQQIDQKLEQAGWIIQDIKQLNLAVGTGAAVRTRIEPMTKGVAQKKVSLGRFSLLAIPAPPADGQALIVRMVNEVDRDAVERPATAAHALKQSAAQRQDILRAAFAGPLVPQDPNDEPAYILLERIRAARLLRTVSRNHKNSAARTGRKPKC